MQKYLLLATILTASCSSGDVCEPGDQKSCDCLGGTQGVQICREDGSGWGECDCSGPECTQNSDCVDLYGPGYYCDLVDKQCKEIGCSPDCSQTECGPDPVCGFQNCGDCGSLEICNQGQCECAFSGCGDECCGELEICYQDACCAPDCVDKECGDDGCGGECGECIGCEGVHDPSLCLDGVCTQVCCPDCAGRECGPDGCGGLCGTCTDPEVCNVSTGQCVVCTPDCTGRECGPDPVCGTICGTCEAGELCTVDGQCIADCVPDCSGRECGPDPVCHTSCGACAGDEVCSADGLCLSLAWSAVMQVDGEEAGFQLDLATTPDDHFALAYFQWLQDLTGCTQPILGQPAGDSVEYRVRFATHDGTSWSTGDVATVVLLIHTGISLAFDGTTPLIAYLGGADYGDQSVCGGSDLLVASGPAPWNVESVVAFSGEAVAGPDCPLMQGICDFGDVVGLWPSMARAPDGTIGVVYRDIHNGYTMEADDAADLEYASGHPGDWDHEWIDLGRGGGDFNSLAFDGSSAPAVAYVNARQHTSDDLTPLLFATRPFADFTQRVKPCSGPGDCPHGQACNGGECVCSTDDQCESPRRCVLPLGVCSAVIDGFAEEMREDSISLAVAPGDRYLVAYHDADERTLMIAHSTDGINWERGIIDADGNTGLYPSLAIHPSTGRPLVAYYRCNEFDPSDTGCDPAHDGVRFAHFIGDMTTDLTTQTACHKTVVSDEPDSLDGRYTSVAVLSDGTVGIAYQLGWVDPATSEVHHEVVFQMGTWE